MNDVQQWNFAEKVITQGLYGLVVGMAIFIVGLLREWWVMGPHFRAVVRDKDEYKALNQTTEETAKKTLQLLAEVLQKLEGRP